MKLLSILIISAFAAFALVHTTSGFVTPVRSIKNCVDINGAAPDTCEKVCKSQLPGGWNSPLQSNFVANIEFSEETDKKQCCCKYDALWNIPEADDWRVIVSGIYENFRTRLMGEKHACSSLHSFSPSSEVQAYKTMCKYKQITRPLTMLEISEYLRAGSSLNPKSITNTAIKRRLSEQHSLIFSSHIRQLFEGHLNLLLDHKRDQPSESPFEVDQIIQLVEVANKLKGATKYFIALHRSLDELIVSRIIVSILDARKTMDELNQMFRNNSFESLIVNAEDPLKANVVGFSCEKFVDATNVLSNLYKTTEMAFNSLSAPKGFKEMSDEWLPLQTLKNSITVYSKLIGARCNN